MPPLARTTLFSTYPASKKRKTSTKRKKYITSAPALVRLGKQPFPKQLINTVKYCDNVVMTLTSGILNYYIFSCNGCYDPNITGTGHQPLYFDKLASIYNHYTVLSSKIRVDIIPAASPTGPYTSALTAALFKDDDTSPSIAGNITTAMERPEAKWITMQGNTSDAKYSLYNYWSARTTFGEAPTANDDLQGNFNNNPVEQTYYVIAASDTSAVTSTLTLSVSIEYTTFWDELVSEVQS